MGDYYAEEYYARSGLHDSGYGKPSLARRTYRREIPQAFMNTRWGRDEADGLHEHLADPYQIWLLANTDQLQSTSQRTLPSSGGNPFPSRARDENHESVYDLAQKRIYTPSTREHVPRRSLHDQPPQIPPRSSSRPRNDHRIRDPLRECQDAELREVIRKSLLQNEAGDDYEIRSGSVNVHKPSYVHGQQHSDREARALRYSKSHHESENRPRKYSEFLRREVPIQPLRRSRGRPHRPSWW